MDKKIHFSKYDKTNELATEKQTYGCRCYNPDICKYNGDSSCAFYNEKNICTTPPKSWKKTFEELKKNNQNDFS